jgi:hypothetical protein
MSLTYPTDIQSIRAHQDSRYGRIVSGRGARAESSLTILTRALRRSRNQDQGAGRPGMP